MNVLKISDLTPHPKNDYFFDDVSGEKWERLLESIKRNGVRTPIIVTDSMVIVSGNQRVRACKKLGILTINGEVVHYANDDDVIRDLIEINIRQRGIIDDSEIKQGRRFEFLQQYYGVKEGRPQKLPNNSEVKTQKQIADESGVSVDTMNNYIKLSQMIPEMQELLEQGTVTKTTALSIVKKLSTEEQAQLAEQISEKEKVTGSEAQQYIDELKAAREENAKLRTAISEQGARNAELQHKLENRPPAREIVKEVTVEVVPDDYEALKSQAKNADIYQKDFRRMQSEYEKMSEKWKQAEREKEQLIADHNKPDAEKAENLKRSALFFCAGVSNFIEKYGGYIWLTEHINELEPSERKGYVNAVNAINAWVIQMKNNLGETV